MIHDLSKVLQQVREQLDLDKPLKERISFESHLIYRFLHRQQKSEENYTGQIYLITDAFKGPVFYFSFGQTDTFTVFIYKTFEFWKFYKIDVGFKGLYLQNFFAFLD